MTHRRFHFAIVPCLVLALAASAGPATTGSAQAPAAPAAPEATPFAPASAPPPPPAADGGLFPAPGAPGRPAPPSVPNRGELRTSRAAAAKTRANRRAGNGGGRQRRAGDPSLDLAATDPVEIRIAYRRAETEAKRDPRFHELLRQADLAHDDEERRALLREYYTTLFARVRRLNSSPALAAHVAVLSRAAEQRYAPRRRVGGTDEREAGRDRSGRR